MILVIHVFVREKSYQTKLDPISITVLLNMSLCAKISLFSSFHVAVFSSLQSYVPLDMFVLWKYSITFIDSYSFFSLSLCDFSTASWCFYACFRMLFSQCFSAFYGIKKCLVLVFLLQACFPHYRFLASYCLAFTVVWEDVLYLCFFYIIFLFFKIFFFGLLWEINTCFNIPNFQDSKCIDAEKRELLKHPCLHSFAFFWVFEILYWCLS